MCRPPVVFLPVLLCAACAAPVPPPGRIVDRPWVRHTIDGDAQPRARAAGQARGELEGADGVKLADVNGDGLPDVTTGWEEGGTIRVCFNPGPAKAKDSWPAVTVGRVQSPEDAVFADLDGDGALDVVSCCEGHTQSVFFHWGPRDRARLLDAAAWTTVSVPALEKKSRWMFCLPMQVDGRRGVDLVIGSKPESAQLGWLQAPDTPRDAAAWAWHPLYEAGWIMSILFSDMDGDGDADILASDRYGATPGCLWLENPGPGPRQEKPWPVHRIGPMVTTMFITQADLDGDGLADVVASVKPRAIQFHRRRSADGRSWKTSELRMPETAGTAKAVRVADLDLDGRPDLVFTCEQADGPLRGCMWMSCAGRVDDAGAWTAHDVSGPEGTKYDLIEPLDLDGDGDLDVMTCEERENLGVFWYENPARP